MTKNERRLIRILRAADVPKAKATALALSAAGVHAPKDDLRDAVDSVIADPTMAAAAAILKPVIDSETA